MSDTTSYPTLITVHAFMHLLTHLFTHLLTPSHISLHPPLSSPHPPTPPPASSATRKAQRALPYKAQWEEALAHLAAKGTITQTTSAVTAAAAVSAASGKTGKSGGRGGSKKQKSVCYGWICPACLHGCGSLQVLGRGVQVWWVDDARYYNGTINAYDVPSGKHRVSMDCTDN